MTADEIIASVLKHRSIAGGEFFIATGVAVLVDEVMMLRSDLDRLRHRERVCDSQCGPIQFMADAWYRAEREFDLPDDDPYEAIVRLRKALAAIRHLIENDPDNLNIDTVKDTVWISPTETLVDYIGAVLGDY